MTTSTARIHGAEVLRDGGVRFSVWAARAENVRLRVASGQRVEEHSMCPNATGVFEAVVAEAVVGDLYGFLLDDGRERPDPASIDQPAGIFGPSRVEDPACFAWTDHAWRGIGRADLVFYELHVGTFSRAGTFDGVIEHLPRLAELGITAIELMPIGEFPGSRNWGYDGVFPYAAQSTYGGPRGLARLVDAAHANGLAVFLDVVYNHLGPEGNVLADYAPYFTDRYRTPWGEAVNFDGPDSDVVRQYFIGNAVYWLDSLHLDGLRLDAVHAICDFSAVPFLAELAASVRALETRLGRCLHVVAESDDNDPRLARPFALGGMGLDGLWCDDFHHAVHAALTKERDGYYADFGDVADVAKSLADGFVYDGRYSRFRRRRHGAKAADLAADRFVAFSQNHDQIGNRAAGERLVSLVSPERVRLAAAVTLLSPYLPLLFMGEEYGEPAPFLYFIDHVDPALREAVRRGRLSEFEAFGWQDDVPDPGAEQTFESCRLDHTLRRAGEHAELEKLYRDLLEARRDLRRRCGPAIEHVVDNDGNRITLRYQAEGRTHAFMAMNFDAEEASLSAPEGSWQRRLTTDRPRVGGAASRAPAKLEGSGSASLVVAPNSAVLYLGEKNS